MDTEKPWRLCRWRAPATDSQHWRGFQESNEHLRMYYQIGVGKNSIAEAARHHDQWNCERTVGEKLCQRLMKCPIKDGKM